MLTDDELAAIKDDYEATKRYFENPRGEMAAVERCIAHVPRLLHEVWLMRALLQQANAWRPMDALVRLSEELDLYREEEGDSSGATPRTPDNSKP